MVKENKNETGKKDLKKERFKNGNEAGCADTRVYKKTKKMV